jgi:hypothetical protein
MLHIICHLAAVVTIRSGLSRRQKATETRHAHGIGATKMLYVLNYAQNQAGKSVSGRMNKETRS